MLMKKPEHKRFEYNPRYYNPEQDKSQKLKDRMEIARKFHLHKKKNNRFIIYLLIIILILYLAIKFNVF